MIIRKIKQNLDKTAKTKQIAKYLGYKVSSEMEDVDVKPKGYRLLSKIPKVPTNIVENIVKSFHNLQNIINADTGRLDKVDGIGETRAKNIQKALLKTQEQYMLENIF